MNLQTMVGIGSGTAAVFLTLLEIVPIKINPWSALARKLGRAMNKEVLTKVENLEREVRDLRRASDERYAVDCRSRILRFGDELLHDVHHSKEHFDQILRDIKSYEDYCERHPAFENNTTLMTTKQILATYQHCMETHGFL